jgi:hypothetical protein
MDQEVVETYDGKIWVSLGFEEDFNEAERLAMAFDRPSLHLRPHGVERFFASASTLNFPLGVNGNAVRHKSWLDPISPKVR